VLAIFFNSSYYNKLRTTADFLYKFYTKLPSTKSVDYLERLINQKENDVRAYIRDMLALYLSAIVKKHFELIPISKSKSILIKLLQDCEHNRTSDIYLEIVENVYLTIAENFQKVDRMITDRFYQAARNEHDVKFVSMAVCYYYNRISPEFREKLLITIVDQPNSSPYVGYTLNNNFNTMSKKLRETLLLKLDAQNISELDVISVIIRNFYELSPDIGEILFRLAGKEESYFVFLKYLTRSDIEYSFLPSHYWNRLYSIFANFILTQKKGEEIKALSPYLIELLRKYNINISELEIMKPEAFLNLIQNADNEK
jgi:hypothetical protein